MDDAALEEYHRHAGDLTRFASVVAGPSSADDVVAAVMIRVFVDTDRWRTVDELRPYLVRAVVNEAADRRRGGERRRRREADVVGRPDRSQDAFVRAEVLDAVGALTARQRAVVYFTYWLDQSAEEVAAGLDLSVRTVQRELTVARSRLEVLLR